MMDLDNPTAEFVGRLIGAQAGTSMYQSAAIVMALAMRGAVDPLDVAKSAEFFAANLPAETPADLRQQMADGLAAFAAVLRSMATMPPNAGRA